MILTEVWSEQYDTLSVIITEGHLTLNHIIIQHVIFIFFSLKQSIMQEVSFIVVIVQWLSRV